MASALFMCGPPGGTGHLLHLLPSCALPPIYTNININTNINTTNLHQHQHKHKYKHQNQPPTPPIDTNMKQTLIYINTATNIQHNQYHRQNYRKGHNNLKLNHSCCEVKFICCWFPGPTLLPLPFGQVVALLFLHIVSGRVFSMLGNICGE